MITVSKHVFEDQNDGEHLTLSISEVIEEEHGLHVWPCSIALAEYIWQQRLRFHGLRVIELGAGTALPGILAAKLGATVTLTDRKSCSKIFENMQSSCKLNGALCQMQALTWGSWDLDTFDLECDIILGADVLYDHTDFDDLFATVSFLLSQHPHSSFLTTYECRSGHHSIEFLMAKWRLKCTQLMSVYDYMPSSKQRLLSSSILLAEIKAI